MPVSMLDALVQDSRPRILTLLDNAVGSITVAPCVTRVELCGPLGLGDGETADDLTLVVSVRAGALTDLWSVVDSVVAIELGVILPAWRDPRAQSTTALEVLYLVAQDSAVRRLRLRFVPAGRPAGAPDPQPVRTVYAGLEDGQPPADPTTDPVAALLAAQRQRGSSGPDLLVEALVLLHGALVHGSRRRLLAAYDDMVRAREALRDLVRSSLRANLPGGGWAGLDEALEATALGHACLGGLRRFAVTAPPASAVELATAVDTCLAVATLAAPDAVTGLTGPIDSYRRYLGIPDSPPSVPAGEVRP